jgi:5-methylcytosine-specific restriction endonuclease McrA
MKPLRVRGSASALAQVATRRRGTTDEMGYDGDWERLRDYHRAREPLCRHCAQRGKVVPMKHVDHIIDIIDAPELRLQDDNLQSLCASCHSRKTRRQQNAGSFTEVFYPTRLRAPTGQVTLISGPPACGKTTYVRAHASSTDVIIDVDAIVESLFKINPYERTQQQLLTATHERNRLLAQPMKPHQVMWFVTTATGHDHWWWQEKLKPARVVALSCTLKQSIERLRADATRQSTLERQIAVARAWFNPRTR